MKITGLKPQRRNSRRVSVYLDGAYNFSLDAKTVSELGLCVGMEVAPGDLDRISYEERLRRAKEYALLLLSYRARSSYEIHSRLKRKKFEPEVIDAALGRLLELRLVDDRQFAKDYARDRVQLGKRGKRLVHLELIRLGVPKEDIEPALEQAPSEVESARGLVKKLRVRYAKLEPAVRKRRIVAALGRRGYSYDTIRDALDQVGADDDEGGDEA